MDGRRRKQPVERYELVTKVGPHNSQIVWRMTLPCGHSVLRTGGREARPGEFGAREINGRKYICVPRTVACDAGCVGHGRSK